MFFFKQSLVVLAFASVAICEYYGGHEESGGYEESGGHGVGYSYAKFSGPVSGPEYKIEVDDKHGHGKSYDYVAKPDYHFEYGVEDPKHYNSQQRKEYRNGDDVHGEYRLDFPNWSYFYWFLSSLWSLKSKVNKPKKIQSDFFVALPNLMEKFAT